MDNFDPYIFEYFYKYTRVAYDCVCAPGTRVCVCVFKASPTTVSLCVIAIYLFKYAGI